MPQHEAATSSKGCGRGVVSVRYRGRLGNNLFQYCFARVLAEELQCGLLAKPIAGFDRAISIHIDSQTNVYDREILISQERLDERLLVKENNNVERVCVASLLDLLQRGNGRKLITIEEGCFLHLPFYSKYVQQIRHQWLQIPDRFRSDENDLTIHIRSGDIWRENITKEPHESYCALPFSFYETIVKQRDWRQIHIVTEDRFDPMVCKLALSYGASIVSGTALEDFNFIKSSKNIVLAVSTFSWFAAFLSQAKSIYYPLAGMLHREIRPDIDLWVNEERYHYQEVYPDGRFRDRFRGIFFAGKPIWNGTRDMRQFLQSN